MLKALSLLPGTFHVASFSVNFGLMYGPKTATVSGPKDILLDPGVRLVAKVRDCTHPC